MNLLIVNMATNLQIDFGDILPEEVSENNSNQFTSIDIEGRSSPLAAYMSSGPRNLSFNLTLYEDDLPENRTATSRGTKYRVKKTIQEFINAVESLGYPEYKTNPSVMKPPYCYMRIGKSIKLKGYCNSVNITWRKPMRDGRYICADVSLDFTEVVSVAWSASEVQKGRQRYNQYYSQY